MAFLHEEDCVRDDTGEGDAVQTRKDSEDMRDAAREYNSRYRRPKSPAARTPTGEEKVIMQSSAECMR
jgi:hypothetical protein